MQDHFLYYPQPLLRQPPSPPARWLVEELIFTTSEGARLHGWLIRQPNSQPAPLVIYFGGNAEEVSWQIAFADRYVGHALLLVNYRGYGRSEGTPNEQALFADALLIYDEMAKRTDIDARRIAAHGRSLGSGVAVHLASHRAVSALILTTPYASVRRLGEEHFPKWMVSLFLTQAYDSLALAPRLHSPMLCLVAPYDNIVPPAHSHLLFSAWAGPKQWREISGSDHNNISDRKEFWDAIRLFLESLP